MYILFCRTNQKNLFTVEVSNLSVTSFLKIISCVGPNILGEVPKFVLCLWILLFLNNRYIDLLFIFANKMGKGGDLKLVIFSRCHNCMITNMKKVIVLAVSLVYSETPILTSWYMYVQNEK